MGKRSMHGISGNKAPIIGFEVGSLHCKAVGTDLLGKATWHFEELHRGNPQGMLEEWIGTSGPAGVKIGIASSEPSTCPGHQYDPIRCMVEAVTRAIPRARYVLELGANRCFLVSLDESGDFVSVSTNSPCAAGTGSFLDEQARNLGISFKDLSEAQIDSAPPDIATKCAVFAKSDLIHRQQEGHSKNALWSGLCRGLVDAVLNALAGAQSISGEIAISGGVALNRTFIYWLSRRLREKGNPFRLTIMPSPEYTIALGAAMLASRGVPGERFIAGSAASRHERATRARLRLVRSRYPESVPATESIHSNGNEIHVYLPVSDPPHRINVFLGVDIGSTSTKLLLIDEQGKAVLDAYRRTESDPILAIRRLFHAVVEQSERYGVQLDVLGSAATGSGRLLVGKIIGADLIVNEISAHVKGAVWIDPTVETIFEIGGQDAKYLSVRNGSLVDANMNYICAAGTGAFIEELAGKLGFRIEEMGDAIMGVSPPFTGNRCTIFMEQDVLRLMRRGISRREAAGAVLYSVCENYLERVVGSRPISRERVLFQGATARNRGLVAAFENLLQVEMIVPALCHVLGALGAALLAKDECRGRSIFRGFQLGEKRISVKNEKCGFCGNHCGLSRVTIEGESRQPVWGMRCGRAESQSRKETPPEYSQFERFLGMQIAVDSGSGERSVKRAVGLPRALLTFSMFPFWQTFFNDLGFDVTVSEPTHRAWIQQGDEFLGSEFCLPLKASFGHVASLLSDKRNDLVFMPHGLADCASAGLNQSRFCPYIGVLPSLLLHALRNHGVDASRLVAPVIDLRKSDGWNAKALGVAIAPFRRLKPKVIERALAHARGVRRDFENRLQVLGKERLSEFRGAGRPGVVIAGHPCLVLDEEMMKDLPRFIATEGMDVFPAQCLPWEPRLLQGEFRNMYWSHTQRVLSSLIQVARTDGLYAVYFSSFHCGPDSLLLTYAEALMGDKPFLTLELDVHGSAGGYQTRIEAFLDVITNRRHEARGHAFHWKPPGETASADEIRERTLWIPPMHAVGNRLFSATFRRFGWKAKPLPQENETSFRRGRRYMRGAECLPMPLVLGTFLSQMDREKESGGTPDGSGALFLPSADGPCRYGQTRTLDRILLDRAGFPETPIVSPSVQNAYYGIGNWMQMKLWESVVASDILFQLRCRVAPYETTPGDAEDTLEKWVRTSETLISTNRIDWPQALSGAMNAFARIPVRKRRCPLVGVVGEIYLRFNPYANNRLAETVEKMGGEVWISPMSEWILYSAWMERHRASQNRAGLVGSVKAALKWHTMSRTRDRLFGTVRGMIRGRRDPATREIIQAGSRFVPLDFEGESIVTLGRALLFAEKGADLVVNCQSLGCMHGNITTALFDRVRQEMAVPVVQLVYDGTRTDAILETWMREALRKMEQPLDGNRFPVTAGGFTDIPLQNQDRI
jgi:predicted CoA-substrate-specific enzyme activase